MSKKRIFKRTDSEVIEFALNHTQEEFVEKYLKETAAVEKSLIEAYQTINKDKAVSKIGANSGKSEPGKPLKPVHYAQNENGDIEVVDTTNIPTRKDLDDAELTEDGRAIKKEKKTSTSTKKSESTKKETVKKQVVKKEKGEVSKRDVVKQLIEENPEITNKEIKKIIIEEKGFKACYDSEIYACRKK